jgi:hypothetical protein
MYGVNATHVTSILPQSFDLPTVYHDVIGLR